MRVDKNSQPLAGQAKVTAPIPKPAPGPTVATDALSLSTKVPAEKKPNPAEQGGNILDDSVGRKAADVTSGVAGAADTARGIKPAADAVKAASEAGKWTWLTGKLSVAMERVVGAGTKLVEGVKWLAPAATGLAKAAPFLGLGIAALDIGKAAIEKNPDKKLKAEGMAVMSTVSGVAGVVAWAGMAGGVALLAPVAVPAMIVGGVVTAVALADQFLLGGVVSKAIGNGLRSTWNAITSL